MPATALGVLAVLKGEITGPEADATRRRTSPRLEPRFDTPQARAEAEPEPEAEIDRA